MVSAVPPASRIAFTVWSAGDVRQRELRAFLRERHLIRFGDFSTAAGDDDRFVLKAHNLCPFAGYDRASNIRRIDSQ